MGYARPSAFGRSHQGIFRLQSFGMEVHDLVCVSGHDLPRKNLVAIGKTFPKWTLPDSGQSLVGQYQYSPMV